MSTLIKHKSWILLLLLLIFIPGTSFAQVAKLSNIAITRQKDQLLFKMNLDGAFTEDMKKAIASGITTSFTFNINLYKVNSLWFSDKISEMVLTNTIKYDNLKNVYTITRFWKNSEPVTIESFKGAQELMTQIDGLQLVQLDSLEKNAHYRIEAKAEVSKFTLPFYLHYIFAFVSLWDFETDWYLIDFVY
ncbi:MAG: DUF4390 domain-containing protein [Proteobacteria bacterium]|nr:DUF4390 domain-containing protein [Pseudomonadota bacterium]MBU4011498.1 DUF4390 domain-containing protein [Pseudomonadota bacterium]MBU4036166.1 DUF4390 domain-containing protein [Pseudomonadota bacterium]